MPKPTLEGAHDLGGARNQFPQFLRARQIVNTERQVGVKVFNREVRGGFSFAMDDYLKMSIPVRKIDTCGVFADQAFDVIANDIRQFHPEELRPRLDLRQHVTSQEIEWDLAKVNGTRQQGQRSAIQQCTQDSGEDVDLNTKYHEYGSYSCQQCEFEHGEHPVGLCLARWSRFF